MSLPSLDDPGDRALALTLGYAGLIPFVLLALTLWLVDVDLRLWVSIALAGYAALIVSFLGGIHWGLAWLAGRPGSQPAAAHAQRVHFLWGVLPSLLAWPGLLMPAHAGLAWLGFLVLLCYGVDRKLYQRAGLAIWLTLRFRLTAVAALSCFIGAAAL
ncbi:MAG TPA: DUF3429 domain-containing protein [Hydrogenophaga sp.]|uniref:DUF3429 domain-containing protein n=1 Tax=Hydrogenophaga sp. TaxID=1904254 RepID=UPI002CE4CBE7|nr:DUF3429 domain-containing protein [Hydrogenophaga sp.]HMN92440.1 DUF3429 domain-containing protein [Hydrogenophaga sp.]HMP11037.1 DUF3429 domain-containing protein [Hydrogenophaga sp.]